ASKSPSQNVKVHNKVAAIALQWSKEGRATFENTQTELMHHSPGREDLSHHHVTFDGAIVIQPSHTVKWIGVHPDSKLTIKHRVESAARALSASLALTHAVWGLKPLMVRDLARSTVFPRADYGGFRTAALAALEKEAAILPVSLRLESGLLQRLASYLALPPSHGIVPLLRNAISRAPKNAHRASALHFVEILPSVRWPSNMVRQIRAHANLVAAPVESEGGQWMSDTL
ncbi:hypothetical protein DFH07DRAFT_987183, partial [Mycena maculata]